MGDPVLTFSRTLFLRSADLDDGGRGPVDPRPEGGAAPPPLCNCHDYPMYWKLEPACFAGGYWSCRIRKREIGRRHRRKQYRDRAAAGLCTSCGKDVAITTYCFICAGKKDGYNATRTYR